MRQRVGTWGDELSDDDFACAIAAAGVGHHVLMAGVGPQIRWAWGGTPSQPAAQLAADWRAFRGNVHRLRLSITTPEVDAFPWLAHKAAGIDGVLIERPIPKVADSPERWTWPWQIVDATYGARLTQRLDASTWQPKTLELVKSPDERIPVGLLVVDGPIDAARVMRARDHRRLCAQIVLVAGPSDAETGTPASVAWSFAEELGASIAITGAPVDTAALVHFIEGTSIEMSHDLPIDVALMIAARQMGIDVPIVYSDPDVADRARMSKRATYLVEKALKYQGTPGIGTSFNGLESMTGDLTTLVKRLDWSGEGRGATTVAKMARQARDRDDFALTSIPPRYLQAALTKQGSADHVTVVESGAAYTVMVKIGEFDAELLQVMSKIIEPYSGVDVPVDVIVSERTLLADPLRATILLPPKGSSEEARFLIHMKPGVARLELRVTVLHRNRVLQSGILRAAIDGVDPLTFEVDAIARHHLAGLESRRGFDAAIVANHTTDGEAGFVGAVADGVGYITLAPKTLDDLTAELGRSISKIAADPPKYRNLRDPGTVDILRDLAARGSAFYDVLTKDNKFGKGLVDAPRIQVVAARAGTFLPIELAYSYPAPDDDQVPLCEHAEDALRAGACPGACGAPSAKKLCPMGFWSLSRVIERQAHKPEHNALASTTDYALTGTTVAGAHVAQAEPEGPPPTYSEAVTPRATIEAPKSVVLAVSNRVDDVVKDTSKVLRDALAKTFGGEKNVSPASSWTDWIARINEAQRPDLLVLLPHHKDGNAGDGVLEIGDKQDLRALFVRQRHVSGDPSKGPAPIVLLLGCATSIAQIPYESFVSMFRRYDAAVVISTISTVLGRDAAPVAAALAQALVNIHRGGGGFVGDAMLKLRREMLLDGKAMVLALTAYGDADWMLAPA